ncbi:MAG: hypothetical protein ACTHKJ_03200 [Candidatus Nitrosocosmicus sp.]
MMAFKSFIRLALVIVTIAVIVGNTVSFVNSSFADVVKSIPGKSGTSFAQSCDMFKCITKKDNGDGKPGSPSSAIISCFDFLEINTCDTTPAKTN